MKELLTALCKAKINFAPILKDKANSHLKYKYASLDSVLAAVEPALHLYELMLSSSVVDGHLITRLYHISGEYLESTFKLPDITDPQKIGSAITYYRRYSVCGLLSITADEDDDGVAAKPEPRSSSAAPPAKDPVVTQRMAEARQAVTDCMNVLAWPMPQKSAWAKTISPKPCDLWDLKTWELAIVKAQMEIDKMNSSEVQQFQGIET